MNKNRIKLNESQLHNVIKESVKNVLNEKYDPFKKSFDENGDIYYPRFEKDTAKYRNNIAKQAKHLVKQLNFFDQTLTHAYPSESKGVADSYEELRRVLYSLIYKLKPFYEKQSQDSDYWWC